MMPRAGSGRGRGWGQPDAAGGIPGHGAPVGPRAEPRAPSRVHFCLLSLKPGPPSYRSADLPVPFRANLAGKRFPEAPAEESMELSFPGRCRVRFRVAAEAASALPVGPPRPCSGEPTPARLGVKRWPRTITWKGWSWRMD